MAAIHWIQKSFSILGLGNLVCQLLRKWQFNVFIIIGILYMYFESRKTNPLLTLQGLKKKFSSDFYEKFRSIRICWITVPEPNRPFFWIKIINIFLFFNTSVASVYCFTNLGSKKCFALNNVLQILNTKNWIFFLLQKAETSCFLRLFRSIN